jgi:TRAP-type C4-dicarboxylate transport system permease small subunit
MWNPEKFIKALSRGFNLAAGAALVAMLAMTTSDIIAVKIFSYPIPGAIEWVSFLAVLVAGFAIAQTQLLRGHIQVEFFVSRFPKRWQGGAEAVVAALGILLFGLLSWRSIIYGMDLRNAGVVSMTQHIPYYPFVFALALACLPVCLVLALDLWRALRKVVSR